VTAAGPRIDYAPRNPMSEPDFLQIYKTGSRGYQLNVDTIPLPSSSDAQKAAAWGGTSDYPSSNGVYVNEGGGIYIRGDSSVVMQVDGSGNQKFVITQGLTVTTVTVDTIAGMRTVQVGAGTPTQVNGLGSGVLFSTGHITSLHGTIADNRLIGGENPQIQVRNAYTIAADVNAGKNITLPLPLRYASSPDPSKPITDLVKLKPGTMGLIAHNVRVATGAPSNMEINAIVLAGSQSTSDGSFSVVDYNTKIPPGNLKMMGGIIQKARGPVGTFSGGAIRTGYVKDYWYDPRLADYPPPYFPTTGLHDRVSWRRIPPSTG
jgi:hypothetical protein